MSYRSALMSCCVWVLVGSIALADDAEVIAVDLTASESVARKAEQNLLQSMQKKIKAEWTDAALGDVLTSIAAQAEIGLWIDMQALQDEGIATTQELTLNLGEATVTSALYFVLKPFGLEWSGRSGVLEVSTSEKLEGTLFTRTYDVAALCKVLEPQLEAMNWHPPATNGMGMMGGMGGGMFSVLEDEESGTSYVLAQFGGGGMGGMGLPSGYRSPVARGWPIARPILRAEMALMQLIHTSSGSRWLETDGDGGDITALPGRLVVRQSYRSQTRIQSLLQTLDGMLVGGVKAKTVSVRRPGYPAEEDAAIVNALAELITINIEDQPLDEVLQKFVKPLGIRCWIDKQALSDEGVALDQWITTQGKGIALNVALRHVLDPLGLTYLVHEGTLIVITKAKAADELELLIYNSADITRNARELVPTLEKGISGQWATIDGEGGTVDPIGSRLLVVSQTQQCHMEIDCLLNDLREKSDPPLESEAPRLMQRIYLVQDQSALPDLLRALPEMIPGWDSQRGSIQQLGRCLAIKQTAQVHERVGELVETLNTAYGYIVPKPTAGNAPAPTKAALPATENGPTAPVKPTTTP